MRVNFNSNNVINIYKNNQVKSKDNIKKDIKSDSVEISSISREISKYLETAKDYEVYNEKVEKIKQLIKDNKYSIDTNALAKSILNDIKESDRL